MKYCKYCKFCIESDVSFCMEKNQTIRNIDRSIECRDYVDRNIGSASSVKNTRKKPAPEVEGQMSIFEVINAGEIGTEEEISS